MTKRLRSLLLAIALQFVAACALAAPAKLTILSYHEIAEKNQALVPDYAVSPTNFVRQMDWLKNNGYHFVGLGDVIADRQGKKPLRPKAVLLTFDDGYRSVYDHAYPTLKLFHAPAVIALVGKWLEPESGTVSFDGKAVPRSDLLSWAQIKEMTESGLVEVASHSHSMHEGIRANPQGNMEPAATTRRYLTDQKHYENESTGSACWTTCATTMKCFTGTPVSAPGPLPGPTAATTPPPWLPPSSWACRSASPWTTAPTTAIPH